MLCARIHKPRNYNVDSLLLSWLTGHTCEKVMKKIILISIILTFTSISRVIPQEILFQDDFESYTADPFSSSPWYLRWDGNGAENQIVLSDQYVSPTQALKLECAPGWAAEVQVQLDETPPIIYCEGYVMVEQDYFQSDIGFYNPDVGTWGTIYASITVGVNGNITCQDQVLQPCEANKWYHLKIKYNSYQDLCDVWVDGILKGKDIACPQNGEYITFGMGTYILTGSSRAWFDDIKIYTDSLSMMLHTFYTGAYLYLKGKTDSAKVYFDKTLTLQELNTGLQVPKYHPLTWLSNFQCMAEEFDSVTVYKQMTFELLNEKGNLFWAMYASNELGLIYFNNDKINTAEKYYQQSERIYKEMINNNSWYKHDSLKNIVTNGTELYFPLPPWQMKEMMWLVGKTMYFKLYQINKAKERIDEALHYYIVYSNAVNTLNRLQRSHDTIELQPNYETEQKLKNQLHFYSLLQENTLKSYKIKQSRFFLIGLGIIVMLVIILAIVLIRQNKLRSEQQNLLLQQKLFRSQMNPHFIFNSLTCIQGFITEKDTRTASRYLSKFAKLIRNILDSSIEEFIPLAEEIATIENYLELQKVRYEGKFDYSIQVDEKIDAEGVLIPPMLAQPFIENSIEHGIKHKKSKGNINIRFSLKNNMVVFEVEDDGVGREKAKEILYKHNKEHKSLATAITHERIQMLNKKLKKKIDIHIEDLTGEKKKPLGTLVAFEIPYKQS